MTAVHSIGAEVLLAIDVGATRIKAGLFTLDGRSLAVASRLNSPTTQPGGDPTWIIWDADAIWRRICSATQEVVAALASPRQIRGVAIVSFGADGAPVDSAGRLTYPVISWHCARTMPQARDFARSFDLSTAYTITGYHNYPINTVFRLRWLREHAPDALDGAYRWLMVADLLTYRLCGVMATERTIASTTMLRDIRRDAWAEPLLNWAGMPSRLLPPFAATGERVGTVTEHAASEIGLAPGTPVAASGHDTEIAALGAGMLPPRTILDITGTWEIPMAELGEPRTTEMLRQAGFDWERHALPDRFLCQSLMIAGGVIEWILAQYYREISEGDRYARFIDEAAHEEIGAGGVALLPSLAVGLGPWGAQAARGILAGLTTTTRRGQIARATLEGLCMQLRRQLEVLDQHLGVVSERLRVLGGGGRNPLWVQMKADITGRVVEVPAREETTLVGAALLAGTAAGVYHDLDEARGASSTTVRVVEPTPAVYSTVYADVFDRLSRSVEVLYGDER